MNWGAGFAVGLVVGVCMGLFLAALCVAARIGDERRGSEDV